MSQENQEATDAVPDIDPWVASKADFSEVSEAADKAERKMPYPKIVAVIAGMLFGLLERFIFNSHAGQAFSAMGASFIYIAPALIGAVTVFVAELEKPRSVGYHLMATMLATSLTIFGTLLVLIEGWICAILIFPVFTIEGMLGGMAMLVICRFTTWARKALLGAVALLLVCGAVEPYLPLPRHDGEVTKSIVINAPPDVIWREIADARDIKQEETAAAWTTRIGVPRPLEARTEMVGGGHVRRITWDKKVHFDEVITDWQEYRRMAWDFQFQPDSFPEHALDDHVTIGGTYFDLKNAVFTLQPHGTATEVAITVRYRLSTHFNWYTDALAQGLIGNFEETVIGMYRQRSEQHSHPRDARENQAGLKIPSKTGTHSSITLR